MPSRVGESISFVRRRKAHSLMAHFFATPEDLLPVLLSVESRRAIAYTLTGHFHEPTVRSFLTARDLPTLFEQSPSGSAATGPAYLLTEATTAILLRKLSPYDGEPRWVVDQLDNSDSTVLRHGGYFESNILLNGEVRTSSKSAVATSLQRALDAAIRKRFVRIQSFYVGKQAEVLLDSGHRLVHSVKSPREYDLRR